MSSLTNFAASQAESVSDQWNDIKDSMFGIQNKGLLGRKPIQMYFTDLARPQYTFNAKNFSTDVKRLSLPDVHLFLDPQNIKIDKKIISSKRQTKGGWLLQFWGHDLTTVSMNLQSGFFGMTKGQNLLTIVNDKYQDLISGKGLSFGAPTDPLKIFQKIKNNAYAKRFDNSSPFIGFPLITMVYESKPYTGFFNNFNYEISANNPFNINFNFSFTIVPTNVKLMFEQTVQNTISAFSPENVGGTIALGAAQFISNPSGTVQQVYQGSVDLAMQFLQSSLNGALNGIGIESMFDDIFPSQEELD
jgi:hypothetical protein